MPGFVNVFNESGPASQCVGCGAIVRSGMEMDAHECPHEREQRLESERQRFRDLIAKWPDAKQEAFDALAKANDTFLRTWERAGPLGSHQFEKFDLAVHLAKAAKAKADALKQNPPASTTR